MFLNLKIAITDAAHLKAVCDVLESLGYEKGGVSVGKIRYVFTNYTGSYDQFFGDYNFNCEVVTLADLLRMRDDSIKAKSSSL